jgi:UDP-glucose 4-epimerase
VRALVTGGAGFIGSNLVDRLLAEGHTVDVVDDLSTGSLSHLAGARATGGMSFHQADVRTTGLQDLFARRRPEVVFHLAARGGVAESWVDPVAEASISVVGSLNVLEACRRSGVGKLVFASSGAAVYGEVAKADLPLRETHPLRPISPHGLSKRTVGEYLVAYRDLHDLEFTNLLLGNVYGARQRPSSGVVAAFARQLLAGRPCTLYGGRQTRDFIYVDDVVDAFARAARRGGGLFLNIGTGVATTIQGLFQSLATMVAGAPEPQRLAERQGHVLHNALDPARAGIHLGWAPWTPLATGSAAVLEWMASQPEVVV